MKEELDKLKLRVNYLEYAVYNLIEDLATSGIVPKGGSTHILDELFKDSDWYKDIMANYTLETHKKHGLL